MIYFVLVLAVAITANEAARILAVYPTPSISHQVVFRPLTLELIKRGHDVTVITTDPIFPKGAAPANLTEIDVHDLSYKLWTDKLMSATVTQGSKDDFKTQIQIIYEIMVDIFTHQLSTVEVQSILYDKTKKFDLLLLEAYLNAALSLSHVFDAPVIQVSSFGAVIDNLESVGAAMHPLLHPTLAYQRVFNLTFRDKINELYFQYNLCNVVKKTDAIADKLLKEVLGPDVPPISELKHKVDMLFLNVHPIWELNRPVPPNVIYMGGMHQNPEKELPKDLKEYLDSSKNGVIYVSFGTNVDPSLLPPHKIQTMVNVFSKTPYDVLWKWNKDELPGRSANIRISKWLPQSDLLRHPKVKLFVTQGGLQSTDEAITAGVPLIGIPLLGDQWFNVEHYVNQKIGLYVDMETITEGIFNEAVNKVLSDVSYRRNIKRLGSIMRDQPQSSLERAVWWTEYVIRHRGARHLRSPSANVSWAQYLELELGFYLLAASVFVILLFVLISLKLYKLMYNQYLSDKKLKSS